MKEKKKPNLRRVLSTVSQGHLEGKLSTVAAWLAVPSPRLGWHTIVVVVAAAVAAPAAAFVVGIRGGVGAVVTVAVAVIAVAVAAAAAAVVAAAAATAVQPASNFPQAQSLLFSG